MSRHPRLLLVAATCLILSACDTESLVTVDELEQVSIDELIYGNINIDPDPEDTAPLTARMAFESRVPVQISIRIAGEEPLEHTFSGTGTTHVLPILGLYPDRNNEVVVRLDDNTENRYAVDTLHIATEPLPEFLPTIDIQAIDRLRMEPGWNLSSLSIAQTGSYHSHPIMFDYSGDIRWTLDLSRYDELVILVRRLANGNLLYGVGSELYEVDMLGTPINQWNLAGYRFHHDVTEKPDGNFIVAVDKIGIGSAEDHVIEIDRSTGSVVTEWDLRQILDVDRFDFQENAYDWFHMNSVWYEAEDDALILSGRHQGVVKVTRDNELVWILAPHQGWGQAGVNGDGFETSGYLLTAVDASGDPYPEDIQQGTSETIDFRWTWGQHAAMILENGDHFILDNGVQRQFSSSTPTFTRGVQYQIDEENMTVRQVWQYGEDRGKEFYSSIISDVDELDRTGNRLIMPGIIFEGDPYAMVTEVEYPGGRLVFDAKIRFENHFAPGQSGGWGNFDLVYRSERMPIYP